MSDESRQLEYAAPENTPPNVEGLLQAARWLCWIGLVVPLAALGGAAWAAFAAAQPFVEKQDKEAALGLMIVGVVTCMLNATLLIAICMMIARGNW